MCGGLAHCRPKAPLFVNAVSVCPCTLVWDSTHARVFEGVVDVCVSLSGAERRGPSCGGGIGGHRPQPLLILPPDVFVP